MNWLLYIGGWILGWAIFNGLWQSKIGDNWISCMKIISWTTLWIWFCWRFI